MIHPERRRENLKKIEEMDKRDTEPKFVSQGVVDQIRWERDIALSQLEQIGKGLGSKMDDIVALLKEQEAVEPGREGTGVTWWNVCGNCRTAINPNDKYCHECGRAVKWE